MRGLGDRGDFGDGCGFGDRRMSFEKGCVFEKGSFCVKRSFMRKFLSIDVRVLDQAGVWNGNGPQNLLNAPFASLARPTSLKPSDHSVCTSWDRLKTSEDAPQDAPKTPQDIAKTCP